MTLRDLLSQALDFLLPTSQTAGSEEGLSEVVTFYPLNGIGRDIPAIILEGQDIDYDGVGTETKREALVLIVRKSATNGINKIGIGDAIERNTEYDADPRRYVFTGSIPLKTDNTWHIEFSREYRQSQGAR